MLSGVDDLLSTKLDNLHRICPVVVLKVDIYLYSHSITVGNDFNKTFKGNLSKEEKKNFVCIAILLISFGDTLDMTLKITKAVQSKCYTTVKTIR